jgi:pimeloyl-ACP methyl ester carboxylesterase
MRSTAGISMGRFVVRELLAHALHGALLALPVRAPRSSGPTVVLVHGHGARPGGFLLLRRALARAGFARFAEFSYLTIGSTASVARKLDRFVERTAPSGDLIVVGHSFGGVIARTWLQEHAPIERVRAFVTLSSPHAGVPAARLAAPVPLIRELWPESPLMRQLRAGVGRLAGVPCTSIISERDHYLWDPQAAAFEGAELVRVPDVGHVGVLFAPSVHALVVERIAQAARPAR